MDTFANGRALCRAFYREVAAAALEGLPHDALLVGEGSDVQGYDQEISRDHNWGIRMTVFAREPERAEAALRRLPRQWRGFSVSEVGEGRPIEAIAPEKWFRRTLRAEDIRALPASWWLSVPQQHLLQFTGGVKLGGNLGAWEEASALLCWYPDDVWRWMLAAQWYRIWGVERLIPRVHDAGDALGAQLAVHSLLRRILEMRFLQSHRYQPYDKWFGTAFRQTEDSGFYEETALRILSRCEVSGQIPLLHSLLLDLGRRHNALGLTEAVEPRVEPYAVGVDGAVRPYGILNSGAFCEKCMDSIQDARLRGAAHVGSIDQMAAPTDLMMNFTDWIDDFRRAYDRQLS